jgi:hypothetical protein
MAGNCPPHPDGDQYGFTRLEDAMAFIARRVEEGESATLTAGPAESAEEK